MKINTNFLNNAENCFDLITEHLTEKEHYSATEVTIMMITKNYIERAKTILILSDLERNESITVLTRTMIELYVSIVHIIENENTDNLALSYFYNYKVQIMKTILKSNDYKDIKLSDEELSILKKELPYVNSYEEAYKHYNDSWLDLFDSNYECKHENYRKWYSLDGKIKNFLQLMKSVGMQKKVCDFYYGLMSIDTHGMGAIGVLKENEITFEFMTPDLCYIMIDTNLSNIVVKLGERYNLLEDERYLVFLKEMADGSLLLPR